MDSAALTAALDLIKEKELPIHALLVIRHGYLVLEAYFYPYSGRTLHDWASVTKSITSTLVGQALAEGHIKTIRQPIADFFPEQRDALSDAKQRITVEQLLMMASGLDCGRTPGERELLDMLKSGDFVASVLRLPMAAEPGREFAYCSGGMHLLSAIVTRSTGMGTVDFAQQHLFGPLGITETAWPADPQGITHGWADLRMHPRDMARIGYLYLHHGKWGDKQILPPDWVHRAAMRQMHVGKNDVDYGYGWWIRTGELRGIFEALGRGGQSVSVWPRKDIVAVMNGAGFDRGQLAPLLMAAIKSEKPLPENPQAFERLRASIATSVQPPERGPASSLPATARKVSGRKYTLDHNLLDITAISLQFERPDEAKLAIALRDRKIEVPVGLDGVYRFSVPTSSQPTLAARGHWKTRREFVIDYTEADGVNHFRVGHVFEGDRVTVSLDDLTGLFPTQVTLGRALN